MDVAKTIDAQRDEDVEKEWQYLCQRERKVISYRDRSAKCICRDSDAGYRGQPTEDDSSDADFASVKRFIIFWQSPITEISSVKRPELLFWPLLAQILSILHN